MILFALGPFRRPVTYKHSSVGVISIFNLLSCEQSHAYVKLYSASMPRNWSLRVDKFLPPFLLFSFFLYLLSRVDNKKCNILLTKQKKFDKIIVSSNILYFFHLTLIGSFCRFLLHFLFTCKIISYKILLVNTKCNKLLQIYDLHKNKSKIL